VTGSRGIGESELTDGVEALRKLVVDGVELSGTNEGNEDAEGAVFVEVLGMLVEGVN
jgi:hypothetical protein